MDPKAHVGEASPAISQDLGVSDVLRDVGVGARVCCNQGMHSVVLFHTDMSVSSRSRIVSWVQGHALLAGISTARVIQSGAGVVHKYSTLHNVSCKCPLPSAAATQSTVAVLNGSDTKEMWHLLYMVCCRVCHTYCRLPAE